MVVPFVNYWWPSIPSTLSIQSFWKLPLCFKFTFGIAHYTPWLYYWWTKQKWYRSTGIEVLFTNSDLEILKDVVNCPTNFKVFFLFISNKSYHPLFSFSFWKCIDCVFIRGCYNIAKLCITFAEIL